jgi:hypothetical protein
MLESAGEGLAGMVSAVVRIMIAYPGEAIKMRMQEDPGKYRSIGRTLGFVLREEGVRALYKGVGFPLLVFSPFSALQFSVVQVDQERSTWSGLRVLGRGFGMGVLCSLLACPIDQAVVCRQLVPEFRAAW